MVDKHGCVDHGLKGMPSGYATGWVVIAGVKRSTTLHRKVYYESTGVLPDVVRHTCDNPRCINLEHLVAGTQVDNMRDMRERGRSGDCRNFGSANGRTVLTPDEVLEIRTTYIKGSKLYGLPALANKYGVGTSQIHRIIRGTHHAKTT